MPARLQTCRPRWLAGTKIVVLTVISPGCTFGPDLSEEAANLPRATYAAPALPDSEISYIYAGDPEAPRVIYIHGTPGQATNFADYITEPAPGLHAISIDRPGFGQTCPSVAVPRLAQQAAAIEPLLVERDGRWPILIGHSLGAPIAAWAAAEYADRVGGLVLLAGALDPTLEKVHPMQYVGDFFFVPYLLPRSLRNANRELIPLKRELQQLALLLERITCPIVIVHGRKDGLVPFENVAYMQEKFAGNGRFVRVVDLVDGNHFLPWNASDEIREAIALLQNEAEAQ